MGPDRFQKMKMLRIIDVLSKETDEQHPVTTQELINRLNAYGISCDRRTLSKDIAQLNEEGFEVFSEMVGHQKAYYMTEHVLEIPELRVLIDAVQAANFITSRKSAALIDKIADLGGVYTSQLLKRNNVCFNGHKSGNEEIFYNIDHIERAITEKKMVSFLYFDKDENGLKVYRHDKKRYIVEPVALIFNRDNYYLVSFDVKSDSYRNYRLDRMDHVDAEDMPVSEIAIQKRESITEYTEQLTKMFTGETESVTLGFKKSLIGVVHDRFGEDISIKKKGEDDYTVTVKVQISPTFWGWIFQFSGDMVVLSPKHVKDECRRKAAVILKAMSDED